MGRLRQQEAMAQAAFEAEVLAGLPTVQPGESRIGQHYSGTNQPSSEGSPAIAVEYDQPREDRPPESAQPQTAAPDRVDAKCAWALAALRQAGILDEVESLETRFGVANASAELRLRGGKRGILIQDVEPLPSLVQLLARFDLVIVAGPVKGRAVVVKTLQQMIADRF
jgi:hypothetical protein